MKNVGLHVLNPLGSYMWVFTVLSMTVLCGCLLSL